MSRCQWCDIHTENFKDSTHKTVKTNKQKIVKLQDIVSIQPTFEQRRFALNESTYMLLFFKKYTIVPYGLDSWICRCRGPAVKLYRFLTVCVCVGAEAVLGDVGAQPPWYSRVCCYCSATPDSFWPHALQPASVHFLHILANICYLLSFRQRPFQQVGGGISLWLWFTFSW